MSTTYLGHCAAFIGDKIFAEGDIVEVALKLRTLPDAVNAPSFLVFDVATGKQIDFDLRGSSRDVEDRLRKSISQTSGSVSAYDSVDDDSSSVPRTGPGRPKLGVVAREVTLLPRHWEWLSKQPGGASVALRKLVDDARKDTSDKNSVRRSQEAAYNFMSAKAGNLAGFEEAARALFKSEKDQFLLQTETWPVDIRVFALKLAAKAF